MVYVQTLKDQLIEISFLNSKRIDGSLQLSNKPETRPCSQTFVFITLSKPSIFNIHFNFIFCWPCILLWFLVNDQLNAQFFSMCLFQFSTRFEQPCAHHQENQLYQFNIWYMSLCVGARFLCRSRPVHDTVTDTEWHIPDVVLIQLILLMMSKRLLSKHVENWNKHIEKNCASSYSFTKNLF
jgi:hypothetical protein